MNTFPTDAERDALVNHAAWWNDGEPDLRTDDLIEVLRPLIRAREAAARRAGAVEALRKASNRVTTRQGPALD